MTAESAIILLNDGNQEDPLHDHETDFTTTTLMRHDLRLYDVTLRDVARRIASRSDMV